MRITEQPVSSAGASFGNESASGKFHGTMAPTTPTGPRRTSIGPRMPSRSSSHAKVSACAACQSRYSLAATGCQAARACGEPTSSVIVRAKASARSAISSPARIMVAARSAGVDAAHGPDSNAACAAWTARSMSDGPARSTRPIGSSVVGLTTSTERPAVGSTHSPPM